MYHPYFRGKQYELITIREMAPLMATAGFRPIIEPVRETLSGLDRALDAVVNKDGHAVVVVNPQHGDLSLDGGPLTGLLQNNYLSTPNVSAGILLRSSTTLDEALIIYKKHTKHTPVFIHAGFADGKALADKLGPLSKENCHVFVDNYGGKLYQKHFKAAHRVLLRDGFKRQRNADYPPVEPFSDLHVTFPDEGMDGFGDFLIVGDDFNESGGPAYAVAIHLTFIDPDQDDEMQVYHFVSETKDTPQDPAGKFGEALGKMVKILGEPNSSKVLETDAIKEFRRLHEQGHFPGLGYVKKLSMNHHIETLAAYFQKAT